MNANEWAQLAALERYREAREAVAAAHPDNPADEWMLRYWKVRLAGELDPTSPWAVDVVRRHTALVSLGSDPQAPRVEGERALGVAVAGLLVRRARGLAEAQLADMESRYGVTSLSAATRVAMFMQFDEREDARECVLEHLATVDGSALRAAYARVLYTVGDFDGALSQLDHVTDDVWRLNVADARVGIAGSRGNPQEELAALNSAIAISPEADTVGQRLLARANVRASLDDLSGARDDLEHAAVVAPPESREQWLEYIRHRLDALDAAGPSTRHKRLEAFPTVAQKWNYCGPAVIELCLRYLGEAMSQDLIAEAVKREEGTPSYAIVEFLREQGMEARRIEATPERVKAAIDLGFPVILEDDLAVTHHVSVATGYDDRIGMLILADPMTHAPLLQGIESREGFAADNRYAGVVVLGRRDELSPETLAAADAAGLVEARHIALLDDASRRDRSSIEEFAGVTGLEAAGIAEEVLALEPDFRRAEFMWVLGLTQLQGANSAGFVRAASKARLRHPRAADLSAAIANWHRNAGRQDLAIAEQAAACAAEPMNANAQSTLAEMLLNAGERELAYRTVTKALAVAPPMPHINLTVAAILVEEVARRRVASREGGWETFGGAWTGDSSGTGITGVSDDDLLVAARHAVEVAGEVSPLGSPVSMLRGTMAAADGDFATASQVYAEVAAADESWWVPRLRLMHACEAAGDIAGATEVALDIADDGWPEHELWKALVSSLVRMGRTEEAVAVAQSAVAATQPPHALLDLWHDAIVAHTGSNATAAQAICDFAFERRQDGDVVAEAVAIALRGGMDGAAVRLLRWVIEANPNDAHALYEKARVLRPSPRHRDEVREALNKAAELAPWANILNQERAWLAVGTDNQAAEEWARSSYSHTVASLDLARVIAKANWKEPEAREYRTQQVQLAGSRNMVDVELAIDHANAHRFDRLTDLEVWGEPAWVDPVQVSRWLFAAVLTGASRHAVAALQRHPEVLAHKDVVRAASRLGPGADREFMAQVHARAADLADSLGEAQESRVNALLWESRDREALEACGNRIALLGTVAGDAEQRSVRADAIVRMRSVAPDDRQTLAALSAWALEEGDLDTATIAARRLEEADAMTHQAPERMALCEALAGNLERARAAADEARAWAPYCGAAALASAIVSLLERDGDRARSDIDAVVARLNPSRGNIAHVLVASRKNDREAFERALEESRTQYAEAYVAPIAAACIELMKDQLPEPDQIH